MVASDSPAASRIGADVLAAGGNAFDAAVATSLALGVARPQSTGLGGGGFLVAYLASEQRCVALDFRETAPAGATPELYAKLLAESAAGPPPTVYGGHAVAVPGQLAGLAEVNKRFGTRRLGDLAQPAIGLAQTGFAVDEHYRDACRSVLTALGKWPQLKERQPQLYQSLLGRGTVPEVGALVKRPELADALRLIAERGPEAFYRGPIGATVVKAVQAAGGTLTLDDLAGYRVRERTPLRITYRARGVAPASGIEYEIVTMPPSSSGGVCLAEALNILGALRRRAGDDGLPASWSQPAHYPCCLVTALQHAFADRARWLGDPDFSTIPVSVLTSREYAERLAAKSATQPADFGSVQLPDDAGTSHFCVADRHGNVVAMTETINTVFGALVVAEPYGIILNNEMDDLTVQPGEPNHFGLLQGQPNVVAPGKRPLSSMTPTIAFRDGRPVLVLGASGGPRIISSVLQVMLNVIEFEMPLDEALSATRLHHQWQPSEVYFDRPPPDDLVAALEKAGSTISDQRREGMVQAIQFLDGGVMVGACDPRKGGRPAGVK